jgi:thiamine-monophosphate kinase
VGSPKLGRTHPITEDELVERIRGSLRGGIEARDLTDDAASVELPDGGSVVVSVDSVVEGIHFDLALCGPDDVGWKALMGALSDLAAMGARPLGALVALCVPATSGGGSLSLGVMEGIAQAAGASACPVVGGDVSSARDVMVAVTVLGTVEGGQVVRRAGARPGDALFVTGPCGASAAGLRTLRRHAGAGGELAVAYRRPVARLAEGLVARTSGVHAMIDVSDGLALDLHRLADASAVGFELDVVPVAPGATQTEALGGGEDYELVMSCAPDATALLVEGFVAAGLRQPIRMGTVVDDARTRQLSGEPVARLGWQHNLG